jgi:hypothetical protein
MARCDAARVRRVEAGLLYLTACAVSLQTGSGKTFTMEGIPEQPGMNYCTLNKLFQIRDERSVDTEFEVRPR